MSRTTTLVRLLVTAVRELRAGPDQRGPFLTNKRVFELSEERQPAPSGVSVDYLRLLEAVRRDNPTEMPGLSTAEQLCGLVEREINDSLATALILEEELLSLARGT